MPLPRVHPLPHTRRPRRRWPLIALLAPSTAALFSGTVAWAAGHLPVPAPTTSDAVRERPPTDAQAAARTRLLAAIRQLGTPTVSATTTPGVRLHVARAGERPRDGAGEHPGPRAVAPVPPQRPHDPATVTHGDPTAKPSSPAQAPSRQARPRPRSTPRPGPVTRPAPRHPRTPVPRPVPTPAPRAPAPRPAPWPTQQPAPAPAPVPAPQPPPVASTGS